MKPTPFPLRHKKLLSTPSALGPFFLHRCFATQHGLGSSAPTSKRKAVTPFNDDGRVPWTNLSAGEKTARAAQQTFNFGMVVVGFVLTVRADGTLGCYSETSCLSSSVEQGGVGYFLYSEVFSPDSKVSYFNRAVDRIKKDPRCIELLGESKKITAYGEETWNKWRRARPIS